MLFRRFDKFSKLSGQEKMRFLEAILLLGFCKLVVKLIPLKKAASYIGTLNGPVREQLTNIEATTAQEVKSIFTTAIGVVPWKTVCLDQALALLIMLKRRRIPARLCLGVARKPEEQKLKAHAWILCGNQILIGGKQSVNFTMVASFAKNFD
jgi:hypothetical protein